MRNRTVDILLVEPDVELAEILEVSLSDLSLGSVTVVNSGDAAMREELTARHHVRVISMDLPGQNWADLVRTLQENNRGPIILLASEPTSDDWLQAVRLGVMNVLVKPLSPLDISEAVQQASDRALSQQQRRLRNRRLRRVTSRIIRERRDLRQRIDLLCRDFVQAYRRLAQRVTDAELLTNK